jgi:pimeloyl-ACP methyl ester carboxylesterase
VPLDHFRGGTGSTDVVFALKRHTGNGPARGVFVTATGGPGIAGIASAVAYSDAFAPGIVRDYDLVFFDQRGTGLSDAITCPGAALAWYLVNDDAGRSTATTGLGAAARTFVEDCLAEAAADPARLPYYATAQAVEDLEALRIWLGTDQLVLYGESYGTQLVQTYAARHPDHVAKLIVDGPVDLAKTAADWYVEQVRAFEVALVATLLACSADRACTDDVAQGSALDAYDELWGRLRDGGTIVYPFTRADGTVEQRELDASGLVNAASAYLYEEHDRMLLQRAIAAASQDNLWYLARLLHAGLGQDPETLAAVPDPSYSDAAFYAIECTDYSWPDGTPLARATDWLERGRQSGVDERRMGALYYGDLPCAFWPARATPVDPPATLTEVPFPMLVMGSNVDPATPWANAERIFERAGENARLVVRPGGAHVIYGRGDDCPDELVTSFLVRDRLPPARTVCDGSIADPYVPIPPRHAADYGTTEAALRSADDEILTSADYWAWDAADPLVSGCPYGGSIRYEPTDDGARLRLDGCAWSEGLPLTGTGTIDDATGGLRLSVASGQGRPVRYARDGDDRVTVSGELPLFAGE